MLILFVLHPEYIKFQVEKKKKKILQGKAQVHYYVYNVLLYTEPLLKY